MSSNADIGKTPWHVPGNKARRPKASAVSHGQFDILDWRNCVCPTPYTRGAPLRNIRAAVSASQSAKASLGHVSDAPAFDMRHIVHRSSCRVLRVASGDIERLQKRDAAGRAMA